MSLNGESEVKRNKEDIFQTISSNLTELNKYIDDYKNLININRQVTKNYSEFFKELKVIKVFFELRSLIDANDTEMKEWESIFQDTIINNNLNNLNIEIFAHPDKKETKGKDSKADEKKIIDNITNLNQLITSLNTQVLDDFRNKAYVENYLRAIENRLEIDLRIFLNQEKISEEDMKYLEDISTSIKGFLNEVNDGDEEKEEFFETFKTFKDTLIDFLIKVNDYYIKRKQINEHIDDPNLRDLLENEYITISDLNFNELEELITTLEETFPELKDMLKLSIKTD